LACETLTPLFDGVYLSNSVTDETAVAYVATGLSKGVATPEDTEELQLRRLPVDEVIDMVASGEILDSFTVLAFQRLALNRLQN